LLAAAAVFFYAVPKKPPADEMARARRPVSAAQGEEYRSRVVKVIDGDTVRLANGETVRYIGIDTPETRIKKNGRFAKDPQPFSREATEYNRALVDGKAMTLRFDVEKRDKYGRLLAYCFVDGVHVNAKMVEGGYACTFIIPPNVKHADEFIALQRAARAQKRGMWGAFDTIAAGAARDYINQVRRVQGQVLNTGSSSRAVFLNFGYDHAADFTVTIYRNALRYFRGQGIDPLSYYRYKTIAVSGRIRSRGGPEIIVSTPAEIEVIQ